MTDLPQFDEMYVVSDIHMGGRPGFQILKHVDRLGRFIEHVGTVRPEGRVLLLFNGDVIDSLAEDINGYVATIDAGTMMEHIYQNFAPVWEGLVRFIRQPGRHLVFVTGNHDIEMALSAVEYSIRRRIGGGDPALDGAMTFATRGAGYACRIGGAHVFCTHGNEVDAWNTVDYDRLGQLGNALNAGRDIDRSKWSPNAGTKLVVDIMNRVKADYPFVDLLKPETKVVVPVLLVLEPELARHIDVKSAFGVGWEKIKGGFVTRGLLGADEDDPAAVCDPDAAAELALDELLGGELREEVASGGAASDPDDMLLEAEDIVRGKRKPVGLDDAEGETLGWFGLVIDRLRGVDKVDALRKALLDWLEGDETFKVGHRDDTYQQITGRVDPKVDFIVTGHTHLERAIPVGDNRFYYNCGTWIRLIRFTEGVLGDQDTFAGVMEKLKQGSMQALDNATVQGKPLVVDRTATVRIAADGRGVVGQLLRVGDGPDDTVKLDLVPGTEFHKS